MRSSRAGVAVALADLEDELLRSLKRLGSILLAILVCLRDNLSSHLNETAQEGRARDNSPIVDGIPTGRDVVDQRANVACPTYILELVLLLQYITNGDVVGRCALVIQLHDHAVDRAMSVPVEIFRAQKIGDQHHCLRV